MKQRIQFRLILPVIVVPFLTLVFWILDGGKDNGSGQRVASGLNMHLPDAKSNSDSSNDKMAFYEVAEHDSSMRAEQLRTDPYRKDSSVSVVVAPREVPMEPVHEARLHVSRSYRMERPVVDEQPAAMNAASVKPQAKEVDPELETINGMLDKLSALQQPRTVAASEGVKKANVLEVRSGEAAGEDYFGRKRVNGNRGGFLDEQHRPGFGIVATIPVAQVLQSGSIVKLQLGAVVTIGDAVLSVGSLIYGVASLSGERLLVNIVSVRAGDQIFPVHLSVYDADGLEGIYVPGSLGREVIKESTDGAIQSTGVSGFDLSLKTQVAAAGIGAAKSLLSKKVKAVRVQVEAGYRVWLHDNQQN